MKQLTNNQNSTEDAACTCDYDNQADCLVFCHKNVHVLTELSWLRLYQKL